jgi:hypothetical protein
MRGGDRIALRKLRHNHACADKPGRLTLTGA